MTINKTIFPSDILNVIFGFCNDRGTIANLRLTCAHFRKTIDDIRNKYLVIIDVAKGLDLQVKKVSQSSIISDEKTPRACVKRITSKDIATYQKSIQLCPKRELPDLFNQFKEDIIDALCDQKCTLENVTLPEIIVPKDVKITDILLIARNREKGDVCLLGDGAIMLGDRLRRSSFFYHEDKKEPLICVRTWITSFKEEDWQINCLPVKLFIGKTEGSSVIFTYQDKELKLICRTVPYRKYTGGEKFEKMLARATHPGTFFLEQQSDVDLTEDEQLAEIKKFHDEYLRSIPPIPVDPPRPIENVVVLPPRPAQNNTQLIKVFLLTFIIAYLFKVLYK